MIRLVETTTGYDWQLGQNAPELRTPVLVALLTDARANDRRGWFGSVFLVSELGSQIWTLLQATTQEALGSAAGLAYAALKFLEGVWADRVSCTASTIVGQPDSVGVTVQITAPNATLADAAEVWSTTLEVIS